MNYTKEISLMVEKQNILLTMKMSLNLLYLKKNGIIVNHKNKEMLDIMKEQQLIFLQIN